MIAPRKTAVMEKSKGALETIPAALYTVFVAIVTSFVTFQVAIKNTEASKFDTLVETQERTIAALTAQVLKLQQDVFRLNARVLEQQSALNSKYNKHDDIKAILAASPNVAWIKRVEADEHGVIRFPMLYINGQYERQHATTLSRYEGATAFDIWPEPVAREFYKNDLKVFNRKSGECFVESYPDLPAPVSEENPIRAHVVCKWVAKFEGGNKFVIVGMAMPAIEELASDKVKTNSNLE